MDSVLLTVGGAFWLIVIGLAVRAFWSRKKKVPRAESPDEEDVDVPLILHSPFASTEPVAQIEPAPRPSRRQTRSVGAKADLPIERSYSLSDGEVRARRHPIKKDIEIEYADYEGEVTTRTVAARSVLVTSQRGYVYLFGHCHLRADERCFRVDRILEVRTDGQRIRGSLEIAYYFL